MNTLSLRSGFAARPMHFGERIKTRPGSAIDLLGAGVGLTTTGTVAVTGTAASVGNTGTKSALTAGGPVHVTAGTGMVMTGPQSSVAGTLLDILGILGLGSVAAWFAANPILGGTASTLSGAASAPRSVQWTAEAIKDANNLATPK